MTITPTPAITALDGLTAPTREMNDDDFTAAANAWAAAQQPMVAQVQATTGAAEDNATAAEAAAIAAEAAMNAALNVSDFVGLTSATLNLATGSQSFTQTAGLAFSAAASHQVRLVCLTDDRLWMTATITAYNVVSGATTVNVTRKFGPASSGSGWACSLKALSGIGQETAEALAFAFGS
jgi:hypothetical protein